MDALERQRLVDAARAQEKAGQLDAAADLYARAGALDDLARVMTARGRHAELARFLLQSVNVPPAQMRALAPTHKRLVLMAAGALGRAGQIPQCVELLLAIGEDAQAADVLERSGDAAGAARIRAGSRPMGSTSSGGMPAVAPRPMGSTSSGAMPAVQGPPPSPQMAAAQRLEAEGKLDVALQAYQQLKHAPSVGRVLQKMNRHAEAAHVYADAGLFFESAVAYFAANDPQKCLQTVVKVQRSDPRYRTAATEAAKLAARANIMDFALDGFFSPYIKEAPKDAREVEAYVALATVYSKNDFPDQAQNILHRILSVQPSHPQALAMLDGTAPAAYASSPALAPVPELPDLPDLPSLSDLHVVSAKSSAPPRASTPHRIAPDAGDTAAIKKNPSNPPSKPVAAAAAAPAEVDRSPTMMVEEVQPAATENGLPADGAGFPPGTVLQGRYRLDKKIGQGGMAAVYKATDLELSETIAIKIFTQALMDDAALTRFRQELKLTRQLMHPNVIRLYDIGAFQGFRYITMELLEGKDLQTVMKESLSFITALEYLQQACLGLQAAHEKNVIHRDVKPENFFVTTDGILKIMDFGIAKRQSAPGVTVVGMIAGTPEYIAPEQIENFTDVTPATDQYSIGVIMYELFTGTRPFAHPQLMQLLMKHLSEPPQPPTARNPHIPANLEAIILKCLQKKPADRFPSCKAVADALEGVKQSLLRPQGRG